MKEWTADLTHHLFWKSEEEGWRFFIPRFVESLQYDHVFADELLQIAQRFVPTFRQEGIRRLNALLNGIKTADDPQLVGKMLDELEALTLRNWLVGENENELKTILLLQRGLLFARLKNGKHALAKYLEAERYLPENA